MLDSKSFHLRQNFSAVAMADLKGLKFAEMIPMSSFCPFFKLTPVRASPRVQTPFHWKWQQVQFCVQENMADLPIEAG